MAKQKKRKKKKDIKQLPKKEQLLYMSVSFPITLIALTLVLAGTKCFCALGKMLYNHDAFFCQMEYNFSTILLCIILLAFIFFGIFWFDNMLSLKIPFKLYFSGRHKAAKKQLKTSIIVFSVMCILFLSVGYIQLQYRTVGTADSIIEYHLTELDLKTEYNDIRSAKVELREEYVSRGKSGSKLVYNIVITITTDISVIEIHEDSFNNNYSNIIAFLDCIDKEKITIDKSNTEYYQPKTAHNRDAYQQIFNIKE